MHPESNMEAEAALFPPTRGATDQGASVDMIAPGVGGPEADLGLLAWLKRHGSVVWHDWPEWPLRAQRQSLGVALGAVSTLSMCGYFWAISLWPDREAASAAVGRDLRTHQAAMQGNAIESVRLRALMASWPSAQTNADVRGVLKKALARHGVGEASIQLKAETHEGDWHARVWAIKGRATFAQWQRLHQAFGRDVPLSEPMFWKAEPLPSDERWIQLHLAVKTWNLSEPISKSPRPRPTPNTAARRLP